MLVFQIMEQDEAVFRSMINTQKPQPVIEFNNCYIV